jgi:hypothetical protein
MMGVSIIVGVYIMMGSISWDMGLPWQSWDQWESLVVSYHGNTGNTGTIVGLSWYRLPATGFLVCLSSYGKAHVFSWAKII